MYTIKWNIKKAFPYILVAGLLGVASYMLPVSGPISGFHTLVGLAVLLACALTTWLKMWRTSLIFFCMAVGIAGGMFFQMF